MCIPIDVKVQRLGNGPVFTTTSLVPCTVCKINKHLNIYWKKRKERRKGGKKKKPGRLVKYTVECICLTWLAKELQTEWDLLLQLSRGWWTRGMGFCTFFVCVCGTGFNSGTWACLLGRRSTSPRDSKCWSNGESYRAGASLEEGGVWEGGQ
jgi:hypothetical protein